MKKYLFFFLLFVFVLAFGGCGRQEDKIPAVMINDELFYRMNIGILGIDEDWTSDGTITSEVSADKLPSKNDQSNFGTGGEYMIADGLYGVFVKSGDKIELFQLKDKGEFIYENLVFEKDGLSDKEFEWLSRYSLADEEGRKQMTIPKGLLEKGIPMEDYE